MKKTEKKNFIRGAVLLAAFAVWTWLIQAVGVKPAGVKGTEIGFAGG